MFYILSNNIFSPYPASTKLNKYKTKKLKTATEDQEATAPGPALLVARKGPAPKTNKKKIF